MPNERAAWREVDKLGLCLRVNEPRALQRIRFNQLAEHYLKAEAGTDALRTESENSVLNLNHLVRDYLVVRFSPEIEEEIKPLDIQRWLKSLHTLSRSNDAHRGIHRFRGSSVRLADTRNWKQ